MVQKLTSLDLCREFIDELNSDPVFSDRRMPSALREAMEEPDRLALALLDDGAITGLFAFLIEDEERYIEMLGALSRTGSAYDEIAEYLQSNYSGFQADFVFDPANTLLRDMLLRRGAELFEEQQKMVLAGECPLTDTRGIEPLSERYREQYFAIHEKDCYWTGEKVAEAADRFDVFLAVDGGEVVGYLDLTNDQEVNDIGDIMVAEAHRGKGWGKRLMAKAVESNRPRGMALDVYVSNAPALALYRAAGFVKVPGKNTQAATWDIG